LEDRERLRTGPQLAVRGVASVSQLAATSVPFGSTQDVSEFVHFSHLIAEIDRYLQKVMHPRVI
jgi:hypothetical protein